MNTVSCVHTMNLTIRYHKTSEVLYLKGKMVGLGGLEPPTSPLSEGCSYKTQGYSKAF